MKFIVDAQLPRRLARALAEAGHDVTHTLDLPLQNLTPDRVVSTLAAKAPFDFHWQHLKRSFIQPHGYKPPRPGNCIGKTRFRRAEFLCRHNSRLRIPFACMKIQCAIAFFILTSALSRAIDPRAADIVFDAYNSHFYVSSQGQGYYKEDTDGGRSPFWVSAEQIEMIEDAYERNHNPATRRMIQQAIAGFVNHHGADWTTNKYNDDIMWMTIACARACQDTGDKTYRALAKHNFDAVYARGCDDTLGGGLYWTTDDQSKNACVNGPAAIAACLLCEICSDKSYLAKAQSLYAWERSALFTTSGSVHDNINISGHVSRKAFTYNEGTFIGAADLLWKLSGNTNYLADALLAADFTRRVLSWDGRLPAYGSGDAAGFNGIFMRWMARFLNDSGHWPQFYGWMSLNADAAWGVRRADDLSWQDWTMPTPPGPLVSWNCSDSVVVLQVVPSEEPR